MDKLIFDRLSSDVDNALNNPKDSSFLKGAYNYTDLNRVEQWCEYLKNRFKRYGFNQELILKKDWNLRDYPTRTQIDRIRNNLDVLKDFCYALLTETIIYDNTIDYKKANVFEKILYDIDEHLNIFTRKVNLQYRIGAIVTRQKNTFLTINTDVWVKKKDINLNYNFAIMQVNRKYVTLKGV